VGSTVCKICFVFDFILLTAYTVDACALYSRLPSLSLLDTIYLTADTSDADVDSWRRHRFLYWYIFLFSTTLCIVFVVELRDCVVFLVVETVLCLNWVSLVCV